MCISNLLVLLVRLFQVHRAFHVDLSIEILKILKNCFQISKYCHTAWLLKIEIQIIGKKMRLQSIIITKLKVTSSNFETIRRKFNKASQTVSFDKSHLYISNYITNFLSIISSLSIQIQLKLIRMCLMRSNLFKMKKIHKYFNAIMNLVYSRIDYAALFDYFQF